MFSCRSPATRAESLLPDGMSGDLVGSVLPIEYAKTLGYPLDDLAPVELGQVEGSLSAWEGEKTCSATTRPSRIAW